MVVICTRMFAFPVAADLSASSRVASRSCLLSSGNPIADSIEKDLAVYIFANESQRLFRPRVDPIAHCLASGFAHQIQKVFIDRIQPGDAIPGKVVQSRVYQAEAELLRKASFGGKLIKSEEEALGAKIFGQVFHFPDDPAC
jgi:hypothetical protein